VLGILFAVFLTRFFYGRIDLFHVSGLAIFMVGIAYILDYMRGRKSR